MIVLGVDPGLTATGYAVIEVGNGSLQIRQCGCARSKKTQTLEARVRSIYDEVSALASRWRPEIAVLEGLYSEYRYPRTAILMGHVRGVICLAADQNGSTIVELAPAEVKQAITGSGRAGKEQIKRAVTRMLSLAEPPDTDHECDALALALVGAARHGVDIWPS